MLEYDNPRKEERGVIALMEGSDGKYRWLIRPDVSLAEIEQPLRDLFEAMNDHFGRASSLENMLNGKFRDN